MYCMLPPRPRLMEAPAFDHTCIPWTQEMMCQILSPFRRSNTPCCYSLSWLKYDTWANPISCWQWNAYNGKATQCMTVPLSSSTESFHWHSGVIMLLTMANADREVNSVFIDAQAVSLHSTSIVVGTSSKTVLMGCAALPAPQHFAQFSAHLLTQ